MPEVALSLLTRETLVVLCQRRGPVTTHEARGHLATRLQGAVLYGDVYVSLMRLVKCGLVETRADRIGACSRIFWPTDHGRELVSS